MNIKDNRLFLLLIILTISFVSVGILYYSVDLINTYGYHKSFLRIFQQKPAVQKELLACYKKRVTRLRERCHEMGLVPNTSLHEYDQSVLQDMTFKCLVDDIHSFIMFAIPKTGCSSWKSLLVRSMINNLTEKKKFISPHNYPGLIEHAGMYTLKKYNKVMILQRLHSYTVALTVRHPFARLESGFKGKILHLKGKTQEERDVFNYPSAVSLLEEHIDENFLTETKNIHFRPIYDLAFPCIIPYNFIGRTETANMDMEFLAEHHLYSPTKSLHLNPMHKLTIDRENKPGEIYLPLLSMVKDVNATVKKLMTIFENDMKLFGYKYEIRDDGVYAMCEGGSHSEMCC